MSESEREFFAEEDPTESDVEAFMEPDPPEPEPPANVPIVPLAMHAESAAEGGIAGYPTEDPGDPAVVWCPSPGVIGSHNQGFRKIK